MILRFAFVWFFLGASFLNGAVDLGVDVFFSEGGVETLRGKRIGLITNHTGVNKDLTSTLDLFLRNQNVCQLMAIFAPEHGLLGETAAEREVKNRKIGKVPVYSLYGATRRPTADMLKNIDVLVYDIQDVGSRSYTYASTLYYVMEEASKLNIAVIVLDRPNPLGGNLVDGPMLEESHRSFVGYIDVPYCHGMTIGELSRYFNSEYKIKCNLQVIAMKGWKRAMAFEDTGLFWIPSSPYIPEQDTPLFYATTGLIGGLSFLSIGIGYTLPFKVVGAPWISAQEFAKQLNAQDLPGVSFVPFHFTPQYGLYKGELCCGVLIRITNSAIYKPVRTQCFILGIVKSMYPEITEKKIAVLSDQKKEIFCKTIGGGEIFSILAKEKYPAWKMIECQSQKKQLYLEKRKKYLLYN